MSAVAHGDGSELVLFADANTGVLAKILLPSLTAFSGRVYLSIPEPSNVAFLNNIFLTELFQSNMTWTTDNKKFVSNYILQDSLTLYPGEEPVIILGGLPNIKGVDLDLFSG